MLSFLFERFEGFQQPPYHPAWRSINLAARVPGWKRYWVAEEKLAKASAVPARTTPPARPPAPKRAAGDVRALPN